MHIFIDIKAEAAAKSQSWASLSTRSIRGS